jgi:broad specificity phosphatase PhoE
VTTLYLVRHGRAAAGWDKDPDPPLDATGRNQAAAVGERLAAIAPCAVVTSPLLRCRQTSEPLAAAWSAPVTVVTEVAEIPSPEGVVMADRVEWLRGAMRGNWADLGERYEAYRNTLVSFLVSRPADTVVFSHFVAINAAIGAALGDDRVVIRSLDNCSVTVLSVESGELRIIEAGHEADTLIR